MIFIGITYITLSTITPLFVFLFTEQSYRHNSVVTKVTALVHFFLVIAKIVSTVISPVK